MLSGWKFLSWDVILFPWRNNKKTGDICVAEGDTVVPHLHHLTVGDTLLRDITDPAGLAVIIAPDTPLLTVTVDAHLLLHLLHRIDMIIILIISRIVSGGPAQTGATPLGGQGHETHVVVTLMDTPSMTLTGPGMIHTHLSQPGRDTHHEEKETIMSASPTKTVRETGGSRC